MVWPSDVRYWEPVGVLRKPPTAEGGHATRNTHYSNGEATPHVETESGTVSSVLLNTMVYKMKTGAKYIKEKKSTKGNKINDATIETLKWPRGEIQQLAKVLETPSYSVNIFLILRLSFVWSCRVKWCGMVWRGLLFRYTTLSIKTVG